MERVLFDQNVPRPLRRFLTDCYVQVADKLGWNELSNGTLLNVAEQGGFDVLLSGDKTIRYEQSMTDSKIAVVLMSDNHWSIVRHHAPEILQAIETISPGAAMTETAADLLGLSFRSR